ncbi:hypothetical protein NS226_04090 [Aureimonas ureilytica]|uniref:Uncharacterized protein n=1 Tax=Aureimonas ureilytica TaxID=401562 RepID=A0A175RBY4_9HYPH|nr:hypothetical protein [Aureimonas ureilytica]KTQ97822.1 hypothetical protein NS226_04090 [Aureimonas ureilytica]
MGYRDDYEKRTSEADMRKADLEWAHVGGLLPWQLFWLRALEEGPEAIEAYHQTAAFLGLPKFAMPTVTQGDGVVSIDMTGAEE